MAYVAFDLDNTLGYFDVLGPLGEFWSPEVLKALGHEPTLSRGLAAKLKRARALFVSALLRRTDLLKKILRPNLNTMIEPILLRRYSRKIKAVIIYSNSFNYYTLELAKDLIERTYKAPGLFSLLADATHPARDADWVNVPAGAEPRKTFSVLHDLLQTAAKTSAPIHPHQVAFVDNREVAHELEREIPAGLIYVQPTSFVAKVTRKERKDILQAALDALNHVGLLNDVEYHQSTFCVRPGVKGFPDLLNRVWTEMRDMPTPAAGWRNDGFYSERLLTAFLNEF